MKIKKLSLLAVTITILLSAGYSTISLAVEKNSCDIMDAPDVDLSKIEGDLQAKIDQLISLQNFLKKARADLAKSASTEEIADLALKVSTAIKATADVVLTSVAIVSIVAPSSAVAAAAATPSVLATSIITSVTGVVNSVVNSNSQKEVLTSVAKYKLDTWATAIGYLGKAKAFTDAWTVLSAAYDTLQSNAEMLSALENKNVLRSQLKSIDVQLNNLNTKINTLKTNLTKMKKLVGDNEKILDKGFLDLINKAKADKAKTCEAPKKDGYTKIANNGSNLPDSAVLGTKPTNWACTKDNKTGLTWEVKTDDGGLRDKNNKYTNYDAIYPKCDWNNCEKDYPSKLGASTNTDGFVKAVNAQGLCGSSSWRLPTKDELLTISPAGYGTGYFEDNLNHYYWSSSPYAYYSSLAWFVYFYNGYSSYDPKYGNSFVRLVR